MVRRSALVYDLLRSASPHNRFSPKEILERVSHMHNIVPGKALRKQINVALRRGVDFGILSKSNNKYRFDLSLPLVFDNSSVVEKTKKKKEKKKKQQQKKTKRKKKRSKESKSSSKGQNKRVIRKPLIPELPPRPRVLPPPDWTPKKRILRQEPIPKVIKRPEDPFSL